MTSSTFRSCINAPSPLVYCPFLIEGTNFGDKSGEFSSKEVLDMIIGVQRRGRLWYSSAFLPLRQIFTKSKFFKLYYHCKKLLRSELCNGQTFELISHLDPPRKKLLDTIRNLLREGRSEMTL